MGVTKETVANWEKGKTKPVPSQFRPVVAFLGFDPSPAPANFAERLQAKRRQLGATFEQVAAFLGWDGGSLTRYLNGTWRLSAERANALEQFLDLGSDAAEAVLALPRRMR
jgi:transcriptional regulator with XRE-family HTH domain